MPARQKLRVAYTPDSDDAFNYYAWEHGHIQPDADYEVEFHRDHIAALNRSAQQELFDVVAVSSVVYPKLADRYWILSAGNSVGRNFGPVLASRDSSSVEQLRGQRVAVGGKPTTGSTLATFYCPGAELVELQYDQIIDAVLRGEFAAGVMIHEEILLFREKQLRCVCDLGQAWCAETGLPLPVGLNLVRKQLGLELAQQVAARCRRSLLWGLEHPEEAYNFASRFGRGKAKQHVGMFSNQDTVSLPADVCRALTILFDRVAGLELGPRIDSFEVVSGETVTTWQMGSP